jgi:hypothetical protein
MYKSILEYPEAKVTQIGEFIYFLSPGRHLYVYTVRTCFISGDDWIA